MTSSARPQPPAAEGKRLPWEAIPAPLRAEIERQLGGRVVAAVTQPGGFSPGVAARLTLDNGGRAFVKAVGDLNPDSPGIHRAEAAITAALPASTPAAHLLGFLDSDSWVTLMLEDVDGRMPAQPWTPAELSEVLDAMAALADALTPAPVQAPPAATRFVELGRGWQLLHEAVQSGDDDLAGADPRVRGSLEALAALEKGYPAAVDGTTLAHGDVRADNILLTSDGVVFVDWPWACLAPPWFDLVAMLPSVAMQGGPPPETVVAAHPLTRGADQAAITTVVCALAGFMTYAGRKPDPPGLPTVRAFQRAQAGIALDWLQARRPDLLSARRP
jgi:aminoglycoside phosphotransferase (APT) family kinase protein